MRSDAEQLAELGYEPALGARPLKRVILKELQDPLAQALLAAKLPAGGTVKVDVQGDTITLDVGN